jgi:hypothetical protein
MKIRLGSVPLITAVALVSFAITWLVFMSAKADDRGKSSPPDLRSYTRPPIADDFIPLPLNPLKSFQFDLFLADAVVNNTDPNLKNTEFFNDGEPSIAINPLRPNEIVITVFSDKWGINAPLWLSRNGGNSWTKEFTINAPPGASGVSGCPCDQTVDFSRFHGLAGSFLTLGPQNIYSALTRNPATSAFNYFQSPPGVAQPTNHLDGANDVDQPWLLVGPRPVPFPVGLQRLHATGFQENVYVAYGDRSPSIGPDMRIAVAEIGPLVSNPLMFNRDRSAGTSSFGINPGLRLAIDPVSGAVYSLFQRLVGSGMGGSQNIDYMLNRSTDGGNTWSLNGSATGIKVANADSTQPTPKFCTVNALLGGVDHGAVDPTTGDMIYVYGNRDSVTGNNRLAMRRLTDNGSGGLTIGSEVFVTGQVQAAIPSVAITENGVIGVFYYTCDGSSSSGFPILTAHFAVSTDRGANFVGLVLETFVSPDNNDVNDDRQRVLGDYVQVKALQNGFFGEDRFFGVFSGNGVPFGRPMAHIDPIFYSVAVERREIALR